MKNSTVATHKIIVFVIFICASIMTSLFIYHASHKPMARIASNEERTIFPVPREIKAFELLSIDNQKFTQKDFHGRWTLLFFGFTHCSNVCPATLEMISRAYPTLRTEIPNLQVVLISLDPERDTPQTLTAYTRSFHPQFIGVTGELKEVRKLQSQLGIFSAKEAASTQTDYQIEHTSSILLINPKGEWAGLFKFGISPQDFTRSLNESVKALTQHS